MRIVQIIPGESMRSGLYRRPVLALAMLVATVPAASALPLDRIQAKDTADSAMWQQASEAFSNGDCATVLRLIAPRLKNPVPQVDTDQLLSAGYELATICAWRGEDKDLAHRFTLEATTLGLASDPVWRMRVALELQEGTDAVAVSTIEAMAQGHNAVLNTVPVQWFSQFWRKLKQGHQDDLRRRLLAALIEKGYAPEEPLASIDHFRQDYAEMLYAAGDKAGAAAQVRKIEEPSTAIEIGFDTRFRPMLAADFDPRAGVERGVARARVAMAQHPDLIKPIAEAARLLLKLGRPQEALAVLETGRARIGSKEGFTDESTQTNWWWNELSESYAMLGRFDDAVAAMRVGSDAGEQGGLNVSQMINLADMQIEFGKPALALETLMPFSMAKRPLSAYGELALREARGCANALAGHPDAVIEDIAFVRAHDADNRFALISLELCMGDLEGAAASIIRQLGDSDQRTAVLVDLSDYDAPPVKLPDNPEELNREKVKARADVQAAIARAGGTRRIYLQRGEF